MFTDIRTGRQSHEEITQIGGHLNESRLRKGNVHVVLKVLVQHIQDGSCKSPEEEKGCNNDKRNKILLISKLVALMIHVV